MDAQVRANCAICTGRSVALIGGVALALATSVVAGPTPERVLRAGVAGGPKMRLAAASFFGGAGTETFNGVLRDSDGAPIAYGNAWSGPFSIGGVEPVVLGPDKAHGLPLFSGRTPTNDWPHDILPSEYHPDRTGFLIRYSDDLSAVEHAARFGWGAATIDAAALTRDGGLVTAGIARDGFAAVAKAAGQVKHLPPRKTLYHGTVSYRDVKMSGDVYVARWRADRKGLDWVWILEKHVDPPKRLFLSADGRVVFNCRGVKWISPDGGSLGELPFSHERDSLNEYRFFAGISPRTGTFLFAGWTFSRSGGSEWWGPLVEERNVEGKVVGRYYDWSAELACQPTLGLGSRAAVMCAEYFPNGRILLGALSTGSGSVLKRHPHDIMVPARSSMALASFTPELRRYRFRTSGWPARVDGVSLACFDPSRPDDSTYGFWVGRSDTTIEGLSVPDLEHVVLWGMCRGDLYTTVDAKAIDSNLDKVSRMKGSRKPPMTYLAVFAPEGANVMWSSLLPRCSVTGVAACRGGLVVVSSCRAAWRLEPYDMFAAPGAQPDFGGGYADGHILLLEDPK